MRKIPTLFIRDLGDMSRVLPEVHPDCQWVVEGHGTPTCKYDGTCVMLDDTAAGQWWARREVKRGKPAPRVFIAVDFDSVTGKTVGWEPVEQSSFAKVFASCPRRPTRPGTYELCGPKINGNPEGLAEHVLISHVDAQVLPDAPRDYDGLRNWLAAHGVEGIVWHNGDGRMAKIKGRDFGLRRHRVTSSGQTGHDAVELHEPDCQWVIAREQATPTLVGACTCGAQETP